MTADVVLETLAEGVLQIRLNRPERMNALGFATSQRLHEALKNATAANARVLLVRGTGKAFCAGADLKERRGMDAEQRAAHNAAINAFIQALAGAPMPTIAVINGFALGGGCEVALASNDYAEGLAAFAQRRPPRFTGA